MHNFQNNRLVANCDNLPTSAVRNDAALIFTLLERLLHVWDNLPYTSI